MIRKVDLLSLTKKEGFNFFYSLLKEIEADDPNGLVKIADNMIAHGSDPKRNEVQDAWDESLKNESPDYSIYDYDLYLSEAWICYEVYSKKYLKEIQKPNTLPPHGVFHNLKDAKKVVDLGNGLGVTTAALTTLFPNAQVIGTNVEGSRQYELASKLGAVYGFEMAGTLDQVGDGVDFVFASEYFEHFQKPMEHIFEVIEALKPKQILMANTFSQQSLGHFYFYEHNGESIPGKATGKQFNNYLRGLGYEKIKTKLWNNRPAYWVKVAK